MSSESDGEYSEIEEEPRLKYKRIGNNILGLVRSKGSQDLGQGNGSDYWTSMVRSMNPWLI